MNIVRHLTNILQEMVEDTDSLLNSYQYNDKPTSNIVLDRKMEDITAVFFQITDFELGLGSKSVKETADINISFLQRETKLDAQGYENDIIIDNTKDVALDFLKRVMALRGYRIVDDNITVKSVFLRSDSARSGVNISFKITELQGTCL